MNNVGVKQQDDPPDTMHMNPQLLFPYIDGYHNIMHAMSVNPDIQAEKLTIIYYLAM